MTQVPGEQLSLRELARCHEVIRAQFGGYERCHRCTGHEPLPHHVRGRSWSGSWSAGTARIRFGVGCDDGCVFGDEVSRWGGPGQALTAAQWNEPHRRALRTAPGENLRRSGHTRVHAIPCLGWRDPGRRISAIAVE